MSDSNSDVNPLDQLVEEIVDRHRRGERPSLTEYAAKYPNLAAELRELFPALVMMEDVRPEQREVTGPFQAREEPDDTSRPVRLGDYRILREVGRGGMGIVYEAEQESLGRHVAIKVLPSHSLLDPQRLSRFQREAKAAARLHHTNIVPVFGVGEADGLHYYVMQFIQGQGLDQVLTELRLLRYARPIPEAPIPQPARHTQPDGAVSALEVAHSLWAGTFAPPSDLHSRATVVPAPPCGEAESGPVATSESRVGPAPVSSTVVHLPGQPDHATLTHSGRSYWQSVARIGVQVAEALAYAHGQGVLHRDIKPSNLLLDTHGTVWVTDLGLAKASDSDDLTHTGDIVGTVRYMAPERFQGQSDPRGDVYSLGLTLYEMLTLRPAFEETDRNKLLKLILHEEPVQPRKLAPDVPRDLETVVLKALAKEPALRYQSATEMAEDLKRFVDDKPVRARRISEVERVVRWCRRNPVMALLYFSLVILLVVLAIGSTCSALWLRTERDKVVEEKQRADGAEEERRVELVSSLLTATPDSVPYIVETLQSSRELAVDRLRQKLEDASAGERQRLRASIALTFLQEPHGDFLVEHLLSAPAAESRNLLSALAAVKDSVIGPLRERADKERQPSARCRLATSLLQLGQPGPARQVLAFAGDPVYRVTFVQDFPLWHGDLTFLPPLLESEADPAFRSGICAALGNTEAESLSPEELGALKKVLLGLYQSAPDGVTHSAAGWALRRWGVESPAPDATAAPVEGRHWFVNAHGLTLLEAPAGIFTMGDPTVGIAVPHQVALTRSFFLSDRETSVGLFRQFMADPEYPATEKPANWDGPNPTASPTDDCPVQDVCWIDALLFCNWLSHKEGRRPCYQRTGLRPDAWRCDFEADGYRLPTEAEWEYACRAGTTTRFPVGDQPDRIMQYANLELYRTLPGGSRIPNNWGFFDMIGNVWEMCWDARANFLPTPAVNPTGPATGTDRVMRGAAFSAGNYYCRSGFRIWVSVLDRGSREGTKGFRVACRGDGPDPSSEKVIDELEKWAASPADSPERRQEIAEIRRICVQWYAERGLWERAAGFLERALAEQPEAGAWNLLLGCHFRLNQWEKAVADANEAIARQPGNALYWKNRAASYLELGQWPQAASDFAKALELAPNNVSYHRDWAIACLASGHTDDYRQACAVMVQRFQKELDREAAGAWPVYRSCTLGPAALADLQPLVESIEKWGQDRNARNAAYLSMLGRILYRAGREEEARKCLEEATTTRGEADGTACFFLALMHHRLGHSDEARRWLDKGVQWTESPAVNRPDVVPGTLQPFWILRKEAQILRREAEAQIRPPPAGPDASRE
jgi:serine/threonine protein kinase/formylglycine-generating enzyme required for sulfatase activity/Flp pilus assembly protein TadD